MGQALDIKAGFGQKWAATLLNAGVAVAYSTSAVLDAGVWRGGGQRSAHFSPNPVLMLSAWPMWSSVSRG